jgi:hypothetical protein
MEAAVAIENDEQLGKLRLVEALVARTSVAMAVPQCKRKSAP